MNATDISIDALIKKIQSGELRLPEMQRRYVWQATRVRDLLDSLYRGYPSGAILVWETDGEHPTRNLSLEQAGSPYQTQLLLLDGQQRLTSLAAVLEGKPVHVRWRKRPINILFNLDHEETIREVEEIEEDAREPEDDESPDDSEAVLTERLSQRTFVVASKSIEALPNWIRVSAVATESDHSILKRAGVTNLDDPRYEKYSKRLQRLRGIRQYNYRMHILEKDLSYEEVAEIFVRVNSLGVKLRSSDLALAQITARWRNLLPLLDAYYEETEQLGFPLDHGQLVRSMMVFATGQSRFKTVASVPIESLREGWRHAQTGLRFAINFLRTNARIESSALLSSANFIHTIAYLHWKRGESLTAQEERSILEWTLYGSGRGYFSSSSETKLDATLLRLRQGGTAQDLLADLRQQYGRLRFDEGDIAGRTTSSGLYPLVFLALQARGAKDWRTGLGVSLLHKGRQHTIQAHHIFPKAVLRGRYDRRLINEISNLAFIGGKTNRKISADKPTNYLPKIVDERGPGAMDSQCVPLDPGLWEVERYEDFLRNRRRSLAEAVNNLLDNV